MTTMLKNLKLDRVDLVDDGACSAAFVTLYKGKELKDMAETLSADEIIEHLRPEHAEVLKSKMEELSKAADEEAGVEDRIAALEQTVAQIVQALQEQQPAADDGVDKADDDEESSDEESSDESESSDDEESDEEETEKASSTSTTNTTSNLGFDNSNSITKALDGCDPVVKQYVEQVEKQKAAAEEAAKIAIEKEKHETAVNKAAELKALPVEQEKLVKFIEGADDDEVDMLSSIAAAIDTTVLSEVGKSAANDQFQTSDKAWDDLEKAASAKVADGMNQGDAMAAAIRENPDTYSEYLGGAR